MNSIVYGSPFIVTFLVMMGAVAFFTLLERKLLGYFQIRLGPNKVGIKGLGQPIADAMKLFMKEFMVPDVSNKFMFVLGPCVMMMVGVGVWVLYPMKFASVHFLMGFLLFVCASSSGVYGVIMCGWASNSKYAYLGCVRAAAQFVSYEVCMVLLVLVVIFMVDSFCLSEISWFWGMVFFPLFLMWLVAVLAETNRAPFDFVEGESELVSGFNVEYGGVGFAMIFIAEYSMVLFMSVMTAVMWLGGVEVGFLVSSFMSLLVSVFIVLCRGGLPRYRYDLLMGLTWKYFLPVVLCYLAVVVALK